MSIFVGAHVSPKQCKNSVHRGACRGCTNNVNAMRCSSTCTTTSCWRTPGVGGITVLLMAAGAARHAQTHQTSAQRERERARRVENETRTRAAMPVCTNMRLWYMWNCRAASASAAVDRILALFWRTMSASKNRQNYFQ